MANNVIAFPKENKNIKKTISIEEINHNVEMMNHYHIQEAILNIAPIIFTQLELAGFGVSDEDDEEGIRDSAFIIEAIRSYMCKHHDIYHPFQILVDNIFEKDYTSEGALKIVDEISVKLEEEEESDNR